MGSQHLNADYSRLRSLELFGATCIVCQPKQTVRKLHQKGQSASPRTYCLNWDSLQTGMEKNTSSPGVIMDIKESQYGSRCLTYNYKTELCRRFNETGYCRYGDACHYAHGTCELRVKISQHRLYKTRLCWKYDAGFCEYGSRCAFAHGEEEIRNVPATPQRYAHNLLPACWMGVLGFIVSASFGHKSKLSSYFRGVARVYVICGLSLLSNVSRQQF